MANPDRHFKDAVYEQFARVGKALCNAKRLELLDLLSQAERTVDVLAAQAGTSVANTSQHLQILKRARLVESERSGNYVIYRLSGPSVDELLEGIRHFAESNLAEVGAIATRYLAGREGMESIDRTELLVRARAGDAVVLDVRPHEEYVACHLPAATSIPLDELARRLAELPKDRQIVAYCRGPYCVLAVKAVELLRRQGFDALRLEDGVREWREHGLPTEAA
jgi:rhodanese-related sulfurtransferase/DNA-binding transcriptional ArsR family regulator